MHRWGSGLRSRQAFASIPEVVASVWVCAPGRSATTRARAAAAAVRPAQAVAAYQRQVRAAERAQEIEAVIALDQELIRLGTVHEHSFPKAQPPGAAEAAAIDEKAIRKQLEQEQLKGVPLLRFSERRAAKQKAREGLEGAVAADVAKADEARQERQRELDDAWRKLIENDPDTVLATLEDAFADNDAPAAAVSCLGDRVDLLMRWPQLDEVVAERKSAVTPTGRPTHRKRSKTERHALYLEVMASNALATVKEAFASAPGLNQAGVLVFRGAEDPAIGHVVLEPLFAGVITRQMLDELNWSRINPAATIVAAPDAVIGLKGKSKELKPIDVTDDPETAAALAQLARGLGWRVPFDVPTPEAFDTSESIKGGLDISGDLTRIETLERAVIAGLEELVAAKGVDAAIAAPNLILATQAEGATRLAFVSYDSEGDELAADMLESFEKYMPLAAAIVVPADGERVRYFGRDSIGNESSFLIRLGEEVAIESDGDAGELAEADLVRTGLERSRARWGGQ